jgi:cytochrome c
MGRNGAPSSAAPACRLHHVASAHADLGHDRSHEDPAETNGGHERGTRSMRQLSLQTMLVAVLLVALAGCGGNKEPSTGTASAPPSGSAPSVAPASGMMTLPAGLDQGPRAGESVYDEAGAKAGEKLFQTKGCSACHAFGKRVTCPDLAGVSMRRTAAWMEMQILHPDVMVKQDPIARDLLAQYALQMPKQGLTEEEAKSVIEFFKYKDHEAGEAQGAGKEKH